MVVLFWTWLIETWEVILEAAPWLLAGFMIAGLIHAWVPAGKIARHLGRPGLAGVLKAAILGVPLPLCSCSVIPLASSMRRSGASRGATAAFLISTPETGVDSISITYALMGWGMAVVRPVAALLSAIAAGLLIDRFAPERSEQRFVGEPTVEIPIAVKTGCRCECECETASVNASAQSLLVDMRAKGFKARLGEALRYGFIDMFADLSIWLVIGFALAGMISAVVPDDFVRGYAASGFVAMLIVLAIAMPLYVCATSSTPIAAALIAKGLSPGTALVFLLVGPATNVATMIVVAKELGWRSLMIYLFSIVTVAIGLGLLLDAMFVLSAFRLLPPAGTHTEHQTWLAPVAAIVFLVLIANGLWRRARRGEPRAVEQ